MSRIENTNPNLKKVGTILQAAVARQSLFLPPRTGKHCFFKVGLVSIVLHAEYVNDKFLPPRIGKHLFILK